MIRTPEEQYLHELIESYVAPLRSEIKALRKELAEQQVKNLNIPGVSNMLPDGFWFDDEHGTTVTVIGIVDKWCMVEDIEHEEPYVLPLEYVTSIYEESNEGNYC